MEATDVLTSPAADADASAPASSEVSASSEPTPEREAEIDASMNAMLRGHLNGQAQPSTSKPDDPDADDDTDAEPDGVSASTEDVKPSDAPPPPPKGRRATAAEIKRLSDENARLQQALAVANPPPPDASEEARQAIVERETRYRKLLVKPWDDEDWTSDDVEFFQGEQKRRAIAPELQQHYETVLEADRAANREWAEKSLALRWNAIKADLSTTLALPGVTEAVKAQLLKAPLSEQVLIHRRLERESIEPELKSLREENAQLKRELLGAGTRVLTNGRSSAGRTYDPDTIMNTLIRGGRV